VLSIGFLAKELLLELVLTGLLSMAAWQDLREKDGLDLRYGVQRREKCLCIGVGGIRVER
jgi:hypothetical protein